MDPEEAASLLIRDSGRMARAYDADAAPYHLPLARRLVELAELKPGEYVLDVGCGTGVATFEAAGRVGQGALVVGIDAARGTVQIAAGKAAAAGCRQVSFGAMDARRLAFRDGSFHVVLSCLGHPTVGRPRAFSEARRVLGRAGRFALCTGTELGSPVGKAFRAALERRRPGTLSSDVAALIEARKVIAATAESEEMLAPEGWLNRLRDIGFLRMRFFEETIRIAYPGPDAYLAYSFAWGDNERELLQMTEDARRSLREEFNERVAPMVTEGGLVVDRPTRFYVAEKQEQSQA